MGHTVTQTGSAVSEGEGDAEGGIGGMEKPIQGCDTSPNDSDSFVSETSNRSQQVAASQATEVVSMPILKGSRRILIVDDEVAIAETLALIFKAQLYDVREAHSAEQAIEIIAEWRPDLGIFDVMLPAMNGIDLAIVLKANHPKCQVLLFSGHANTAILLEEAGRKGHQFEVLAKPVHPTLMLERAAALLNAPEEPAYD